MTAVLGALLFFRELEINRKLADRVLEYEVRQNLASLNPAPVTVASPALVAALTAPIATTNQASSVPATPTPLLAPQRAIDAAPPAAEVSAELD